MAPGAFSPVACQALPCLFGRFGSAASYAFAISSRMARCRPSVLPRRIGTYTPPTLHQNLVAGSDPRHMRHPRLELALYHYRMSPGFHGELLAHRCCAFTKTAADCHRPVRYREALNGSLRVPKSGSARRQSACVLTLYLTWRATLRKQNSALCHMDGLMCGILPEN